MEIIEIGRKMTTLIVTALLLSSCATYTPPISRPATNENINVKYEKAWDRATEFFASNNIPIKNIAKDSGVIASEYGLKESGGYIDCGSISGPGKAMYDWTANINVILRDNKNDTTKMQVNVFGSVLIANTNAYGQVLTNYGYEKKSCVSTGVMENEFKQFLLK